MRVVLVPASAALAYDSRGWWLIPPPPRWWLEDQERVLEQDVDGQRAGSS